MAGGMPAGMTDAVQGAVQNVIHEKNILDYLFGSGLVVQGVLLLLILVSVFSWAIIISKALQLRRVRRENEEFSDLFWETKNLSRLDDSSRRFAASPLVGIFLGGYRELSSLIRDGRATEELPTVSSAMQRAEIEEGARLDRGVTFLATTASAAPFIGLFGTVWGIMNAFQGLAYAKSTTIQAVAPGISEALVATAVGLAAAIPAAVGFNYYTAAIRQIRQSMESFKDEFLNVAKLVSSAE